MKKRFVLLSLLLLGFLLVSCNGSKQAAIATVTKSITATTSDTPTAMPIPTQTLVEPFTPTPLPTETATSEATSLPPTEAASPVPYATKKVLLHYFTSGWHSIFDVATTNYEGTDLVLYTDGQIISANEYPYLQKKLSSAEMDAIFAQLKDFGFFGIETNEDGAATEKLYTPDNPFERVYDDISYCVRANTEVKPRTICAYNPYLDYLIPEMKHTLDYLDHFPTQGMTRYIPDRILLTTQSPTYFEKDTLPEKVFPWPKEFPPLRGYTAIQYFQGSMAAKIAAYLDSIRTDKAIIVEQDGTKYGMYTDILLPHEGVDFSGVTP